MAAKKQYEKPTLVKHKNLKDFTFESPEYQGSIVIDDEKDVGSGHGFYRGPDSNDLDW